MSKHTPVTLVTGAASGIGRSVALLFNERGHSVCALDQDAEGLEETLDRASARELMKTQCADVVNQDAVEAWAQDAEAYFGHVDVLIAAAAVAGAGRIDAMPAQDWLAIVDVSMAGTANCCRAVIPRMAASGGGSIVTFGSILGRAPLVGTVAYAAAKAGIEGMTRGLALDHARENIRVNCIVPGSIDTPMMWLGLAETQAAEYRIACEADIPLGRIGEPSEVAKVAYFLAAEEASFVTGASIVVDGGALTKLSLRY